MTTSGSNAGSLPAGGTPARMGFLAPAAILGFIALTLVAAYFVRLRLLEKAISAAIEIGDDVMIGELMDSFPSPVNGCGRYTQTPLHWAAQAGRADLVRRLLSKGADVNAKGLEGRTPLHAAAAYGNKEILELLLSRGAEINAKDFSGRTPLHRAAEEGKRQSAEVLLAWGAEIDARDPYGRTPLHWAALLPDRETVELLIAAGADINAKGLYGQTPLIMAASRGHKDIVALLVGKGADPNIVDDTDGGGRTAIEWARHWPEVADTLRSAGAKEE